MKLSIIALYTLVTAVPIAALTIDLNQEIQAGDTCPTTDHFDLWSDKYTFERKCLPDCKSCVVKTIVSPQNAPGSTGILLKDVKCDCFVQKGDLCPTTDKLDTFDVEKCSGDNSKQACVVKSVNHISSKIKCHVALKNGDKCPNNRPPFKVEQGCDATCGDCVVDSLDISAYTQNEVKVSCKCKPPSVQAPKKGELCNADALENKGFTISEPCCSGDDKDKCPEYKQCRIAEVNYNDVKCRCVAAADVHDKCDKDLLYPITKACDASCADCRVTKVNGDEVECGCAKTGGKVCDVYAYDSCNYCRDHKPIKCEDGSGFNVSVCADATYKIKTDDVNKICSGEGAKPSGDLCPKKGDVSAFHCRDTAWSYNKDTKTCIAPEDAKCMQLRDSDTWGCVFPTNCNEKNICLKENYCDDTYEKVNGTDLCKVTEAGYPIQNPDKVDPEHYINTTQYTQPESTVTYKATEESFATITNVISLIVGMFTTALAILTSL